eukprot:CAMPEP_0179232586 /NCGR_PEP_ID=MMETSP0797-20121207/11937_1 /TAXON_ID=47934 /ORGANISM="Dinophysis acuminata, Strain DAEP01" /LENGTH=953 /DNA_ID=CAMNT_0020939713 /DNA_START=16 /DNA_END=2877 /DNA_ORIENTATION=-
MARRARSGESPEHWLEKGASGSMEQSHEIMTYLERFAGQMESMLAGQQKLEEAIRGLHTSRVTQSGEAGSPRLRGLRQRGSQAEPGHNQSPLHGKPMPSGELADGDPSVSETSSPPVECSRPGMTSSWSVSQLQQRMLVPVEGLGGSSVEFVEQEVPDVYSGDVVIPNHRNRGRRSWLPMNPDSKRRTAIDVISGMVLLYDCIVIPIQVGWSLPLEGLLLAGYVVTLVFWTVDFLLGFATSFYRGGDMVTDYRAIAIHYLKHDFAVNFLAVCVDWTVIIITVFFPEGSQSQTQFARALRIVKIQRILHLVRVLKNGTIAKLYDRLTRVCFKHGLVEQFQGFTKIMTIFCFILWLNHLGCCFWHWIGRSAYDHYTATNMTQSGGAFDYLLMFYWSVSAVIAGESIMSPTTWQELATTIVFILCGLILVSILVSHLSASLLDLRLSDQERNASMFKLRQYFYQNNVKGETAMPIQAKVTERLSAVKRLSDKDVRVLELVPPAMRNTLRTEVYGPKIQRHFFIRSCSSLTGSYRSVLVDFCCTAMSNEVLAPGRVVFHERDEARGAYYLNWGECDYVLGGIGNRSTKLPQTTRFSKVTSEISEHGQRVAAGTWISDVALWVLWKHCGLLEVSKTSEMCIIGIEGFMQVIKLNPHLASVTQDYSNAMYAAIQKESGSDISDLSSGVDFESVVTAMPLQSRVKMSMGAFSSLLSHQFLFSVARGTRQLLYDEVQAGKCDLIVDADEKVLRVVNVVALRVLRQDGKMLAQIAEVTEDGIAEPSVQLPGLKVKAGELPHDALQRLRNTTLSVFRVGIIVGTREVNVQQKPSKAYGVNTKYMRNIYHAAWDPDVVHDDLPEVADGKSTSSLNVVRSMKSSMHGRVRTRDVKFQDWYEMKPFVMGSSTPGATRKILMWVYPEDFAAMLAEEDRMREWVSTFRVPDSPQPWSPAEAPAEATDV